MGGFCPVCLPARCVCARAVSACAMCVEGFGGLPVQCVCLCDVRVSSGCSQYRVRRGDKPEEVVFWLFSVPCTSRGQTRGGSWLFSLLAR